MSYQTNDTTTEVSESPTELPTPTLIGGLLDGFVSEFKFRGLTVRRAGNSIEVADPYERPLGGYLLMKSASVSEVWDWLEAKAEYYGVEQ